MAIPSIVSNATKTGYYLVLLVMALTVMGYTAEQCVLIDDNFPNLECSSRANAVLGLGTTSAFLCLLIIALLYAGLHQVLKGEVGVALIQVGLWAAAASLVSSPRTVFNNQGGGGTFENSAAFYCSWVALVVALLLFYWAAADVGLKPPLPAERRAAGATTEASADTEAEPVKPKGDKEPAAKKASAVEGEVEAVSEAV